MFAVQRVNNRFAGRDSCNQRTYEYYVPAAALHLRLDGGAEDGETLALLQRALDTFVADRPYHNYTRRCGQPLTLWLQMCTCATWCTWHRYTSALWLQRWHQTRLSPTDRTSTRRCASAM